MDFKFQWEWLLRHLIEALLSRWVQPLRVVHVLANYHLLHVLLREVVLFALRSREATELREMCGH